MQYWLRCLFWLSLLLVSDVRAEAELSPNVFATKSSLPADLPVSWNKQYFHDAEFNADILVVQSGMQHSQTVLLVHGLGKNGLKDWMQVIGELEKHYHVIALDLPGFGYSLAANGRFTPLRYAELLKRVLDHYQKSTPIVVGHSLGGAVALRFASLYPQQVKRLVLVDAAGILERTAFIKFNTEIPAAVKQGKPEIFKRVVDVADQVRSSLVERSAFTPDPMMAAYQNDDAWQWLVADSPNTNAAFGLVAENFSSAVFTMPVPTSIIWGSTDRVAPLRTGKLLTKRLPQAGLAVIDGAGHVPMQSHLPAFMALLQAALETPPAASSTAESSPLESSSVKHSSVEISSVKSSPTEISSKASPSAPSDLHCNGLQDVTYTGRYREVQLSGCRNVTLSQLQADKISIERSHVAMENVTVTGREVGMNITRSVVVATNVDISAAMGIYASGSRLDLAGMDIRASAESVKVDRASRLIISTSRISARQYSGYAHGAYALKQEGLDWRLAAEAQ